MSLSPQLSNYLRLRGVSYLEVPYAFKPADVASATRLQRRGLAKVVGLRGPDADWTLAVVPAGLHVDVEAVQLATGHEGLRIASERDVARRFGTHELAGDVVFDDLSGVPVCFDESFGSRQHIYFPDGSNRGVFALRVRDYIRLARPIVGTFSIPTRRQIRSV